MTSWAQRLDRLIGWFARKRRRLLALVLVLLSVLALMGNLNRVLREMHQPGDRAGTVTDLAAPLASAERGTAILLGWANWDRSPEAGGSRVTASAESVAGSWLLLDSLLFAPGLALLLCALARRRAAVEVTSWSWLRGVLPLAAVGAGGYLVVDEFENVLTAVVIRYGAGRLATVLGFVSLAKLVVVGLVALPIVISYVLRPPWRYLRKVVLVRAQVVGAVLLIAVLLELPRGVRPQLGDIVRGWALDDEWGLAVAALGTLAFCMALLWCSGRWVLAHTCGGSERAPRSCSAWVLWTAIGVAVIAASFLSCLPLRELVRSVGVGATAYGVLSLPSAVRKLEGARADVTVLPWVLLRYLTVLPAWALATAILSHVDTVAPGSGPVFAWFGFLVGVCFGLAVAAWQLTGRDLATDAPRHGWRLLPLAVVLAGVAALGIAPIFVTCWRSAHLAGTVAFAVAAAALVTLGLSAALRALHQTPVGALAAVHVRRVPVLSLVVLVLMGASRFDDDKGFHAARLARPTPASSKHPDRSLQRALAAFRGRAAPGEPRDRRSGGRGSVRPLLFIASSGGGARSAYWTLQVLQCLYGEGPSRLPDPGRACDRHAMRWDDAFLTSGISGGSVGLAMYAAADTAGQRLDPEHVFDTGFVDQVLAHYLMVDTPNAVLRSGWMNRAERLELAWEHEVPALARTLDDYQYPSEHKIRFPILLLESAAVEDGCRINGTALKLAGADPGTRGCRAVPDLAPVTAGNRTDTTDRKLSDSRDLVDYLCDRGRTPQPIRLSTTALLSARFPFISPAGGLHSCTENGHSWTFAVDGGYIDTTAASPIVELIDETIAMLDAEPAAHLGPGPGRQTHGHDRACLQPVVLQIDNDYARLTSTGEPSRPQELLAPLIGQRHAKAGRDDAARQVLAEAASRRVCAGIGGRPTYFHVYPHAHPGAQAPLGWQLSAGARSDLDHELLRTENQCALLALEAWFAPTDPTGRRCVSGKAVTTHHGSGGEGAPVAGVVVGVRSRPCHTTVPDCAISATDGTFALVVSNGARGVQIVDDGGAHCKVATGTQEIRVLCGRGQPSRDLSFTRWLVVVGLLFAGGLCLTYLLAFRGEGYEALCRDLRGAKAPPVRAGPPNVTEMTSPVSPS